MLAAPDTRLLAPGPLHNTWFVYPHHVPFVFHTICCSELSCWRRIVKRWHREANFMFYNSSSLILYLLSPVSLQLWHRLPWSASPPRPPVSPCSRLTLIRTPTHPSRGRPAPKADGTPPGSPGRGRQEQPGESGSGQRQEERQEEEEEGAAAEWSERGEWLKHLMDLRSISVSVLCHCIPHDVSVWQTWSRILFLFHFTWKETADGDVSICFFPQLFRTGAGIIS